MKTDKLFKRREATKSFMPYEGWPDPNPSIDMVSSLVLRGGKWVARVTFKKGGKEYGLEELIGVDFPSDSGAYSLMMLVMSLRDQIKEAAYEES